MNRAEKGKGHGPQRNRQPARPDPAGTSARQSADGVTPVVLIVEDEEPIAEALAFLVEDCGYVALRAAHGREALELARTHHPGLVITDLMMPIMGGRELIETLRADAARDGNATPTIILTTAGGFSVAQATGADVVLRKPFDISEVERILALYLGPAKHEN